MPGQPNNNWTIQLLNPDGSVSGLPFSLASLGIESATGDENNMAADVLTLTVGGRAIDAAALWPYGQLLALIDPINIRRFVGRVEPWSREGMPDNQSHFGRVVGPWWYLAQKIYQQRYNFPEFGNGPADDNVVGYTNYNTSRVILYILYQGVPQAGQPAQGFFSANTGQQIADAVNWAISQGAPIKLGQVDPTTTPFSSFQKGITCAEVIHHAYRFEPDFKVVWDYTTLPFPTIHFLKQKSFIPLVIDLTTPGVREKITIKERPDWQRSYVVINYDEIQTVGDRQFLEIFQDFYPNPFQPAAGMSQTEFNFRGVDLYCDLSGEKISQQNQQANFASQPFNIASLATWQKWKPGLDPLVDPTITSVIIMGANTIPPANVLQTSPNLTTLDEIDDNGQLLPLDPTVLYEITDGAWADWIPASNAQRVRATAFAFVAHKAAPGQNPKTEIIPLSHDFTAVSINTAGITQSFTQATSTGTFAEPIPLGLAKMMFASWQNLAIEGSFQNTEAVIGSSQPISSKNCLNFKGAQAAWAAVNAIIQKRTWNIEKGTNNIAFGAPLILTGLELIEVIRATRYRITTVDLAYIFGGPLPGAGTTRMSRKHHARHSQNGEKHRVIHQISASPDPSNPVAGAEGVITLDPTITTPGSTGPSVAINAQDILNASMQNTGGA